MKRTLLDMTQDIMSSLSSDEINSISDTQEALQVATIIKTTYFDLITRLGVPEHFSLVTLDASGSASKPTLMTLPATVSLLKWLKYDKREESADPILMREVCPLTQLDFLDRMHTLNTDDSNVGSFSHTFDNDTVTFLYNNDRPPEYYTTFNDETLIFDSYDADVDSTLQKSKTLGYGRNIIPFTLVDTFTPDLDEPLFPLLYNEAKSTAWVELKQTSHAKAEQTAQRQWSTANKKDAVDVWTEFDKLPNYGRK